MADIELDPDSTAVLITDPQKDFLSPDGVAWEKVGDTVEQNRVVEKLEWLRDTARPSDIPVFYSPHYFNDDEFQSIEWAERLQEDIDESELIGLDEANHWVMEDRPDTYREELRTFLL